MTSTARLRQNDHGVPHDLIEDILVKLPVKSLVRFKYVSEQWFRLITDPCFIDRHLSNQSKNGPGFVTASSRFVHPNFGPRNYIFLGSIVINGDTNTIPPTYIRMVGVPEEYCYDMLNSCDGILCFRGAFNIWVYNPATKEYRLLPFGPGMKFIIAHDQHLNCFVTDFIFHIYIAGPWCSSHPHGQLGIGRDLVTKKYKIVRFCNTYPSKTGQDHRHHDFCAVFTLDPNPNACWKTIGEVPYRINPCSRSVYANGAIYWFTDEICHLNKTEVIVMFDLHNEKFQAIPHPSSCSNKQRRTMQLGTLRECLCLAQQEVDSQALNIWKMEKQQQQKMTWEKLYCIQLMDNGNDPLQIGPRFAFAEHRDGTLTVCTEDKVYLLKQNDEIRCVSRRYGQYVPTAFTESLVPIYGKTVTQIKRLPIAFVESLVPIYKATMIQFENLP
ncbi:hypothetical protein V6N13_014607 [Hibiscus sabdariffa]|uniref:F-box domain-containing protein n=1 Tax=Hibiscus sabdariffa TaxID=183260 RepID=A0ABR2RW71_9ROSI